MEIKIGFSKIRRQTSGQGDTTFLVRTADGQKPITKPTIDEAASLFCREVLDDKISVGQLIRLFSLEPPTIDSAKAIANIKSIIPGFFVTFPRNKIKGRHRHA